MLCVIQTLVRRERRHPPSATGTGKPDKSTQVGLHEALVVCVGLGQGAGGRTGAGTGALEQGTRLKATVSSEMSPTGTGAWLSRRSIQFSCKLQTSWRRSQRGPFPVPLWLNGVKPPPGNQVMKV